MITLSKLSKRFDRQFVVNDVNIKINEGEIVGLLGPNGAGKTTTLRMIAGVLPPSKGSVEIDGTDITIDGSVKKIRGPEEAEKIYSNVSEIIYLMTSSKC